MFHGFDFDSTMLRIGCMNMLLHGVENPDIRYRDSLAEGAAGEDGLYSLVLPTRRSPGSLDYETTSKDLLRVVKTKKTELLFLALFLRLLKPGGRAAVIVPDGVLFGSSNAHKELRRILVEDQKLDAVVKLPSGVFKPYAGVSTAILLFTKTDSGGTDHVWFYDVKADGWSLDDKRTPLLDDQARPSAPGLTASASTRPRARQEQPPRCAGALGASATATSCKRRRTEQSFCVPKADIVAQGTTSLSTATRKSSMRRSSTAAAGDPRRARTKNCEKEIQRGRSTDLEVDAPVISKKLSLGTCLPGGTSG